MIYVRTKPNRVAYETLRGKQIPNDEFVPVAMTQHIARLLNVHKDIEQRVEEVAPQAVAETKSTNKKEKE